MENGENGKIIISGEPTEEEKNKRVLDQHGNETEPSQEKISSDKKSTEEKNDKEDLKQDWEKVQDGIANDPNLNYDERIKKLHKEHDRTHPKVNPTDNTETKNNDSGVFTEVWSPTKEKKVFKAGVIDTTALAETQARDLADSRMTESKEDRSKNWFSRNLNRIWKHGIAQGYYRQKEISKARKEIFESGNLYAGEEGGKTTAHTDAMRAIVERFTSEYDKEVLRKEELETKTAASQQANEDIKKLIQSYAGDPTMKKEDFDAEKARILSGYDKSYGEKNKLHADNLFEIANEVRNAIEHGTKLESMDFDINLSLGKARDSLNSEMKKNTFDSLVEKAQNSKLGRIFANEPTAVAIAAGLYSAGSFLGMKALRSKAGQIGSFGATALLAAGVTGLKESARLERERVQHMRERAKGMEFKEDDMKRREKMEESSYETKAAASLISTLENDLESVKEGTSKPEDINRMIANLADIESRIALGDAKKVDLIGYTRFDTVEEERTKLLVTRARLKAELKKQDPDFDQKLTQTQGAITKTLEKGENGLEEKNKLFKKMKHKKVAWEVSKTALLGATAGAVVQEAGSLLHSNQDSLIKESFSGIKRFFGGGNTGGSSPSGVWEDGHTHTTALEGFRRWISGEKPYVPFGQGHEILLDGKHFQLPEGVDLHDNGDGTYNILQGNKVIVDHTTLDQDALRSSGIISTESTTYTEAAGSESAKDYIDKHPELTNKIHRELWYDNDTPKPIFDKNELRADWGGEGSTGIDKDGNYVFNIARMTKDGSFHGLASTDVKEQLKNHNLKMLFSLSRDTQSQVFEIPIDEHGNALIEKDNPLAKLMFEEKDGHAIFKGKFAEVAQSMSVASDGGENFRILSTVVGEGQDTIIDNTESEISNIRLDIPQNAEIDVPPFIPIPHRRPLERGSYIKNLPEKKSIEQQTGPVQEKVVQVEQKQQEPEKTKEAEPSSVQQQEKKEESPKKYLSEEEYSALKEDILFLNKKIQSSEGIITVEETQLKSELGKKLYRESKDIPEGVPVTFNQEELRAMGDSLETVLLSGKIVKTPEDYRAFLVERGLWKTESLKLKKDMALLKEIGESKGDIKLKPADFKSAYAKQKFEALQVALGAKKLTRKNLASLTKDLDQILSKKKKLSKKGSLS